MTKAAGTILTGAGRPEERGPGTGLRKSVFFCIDGHTAGNPVRLLAGGAPLLTGSSISERRQDFLARFAWIRLSLMFEPRGHDIMSGGFLYPPFDPANDAAILFMETSGCLPMCGHGTIGIITFAREYGLIRPREHTGTFACRGACGDHRYRLHFGRR